MLLVDCNLVGCLISSALKQNVTKSELNQNANINKYNGEEEDDRDFNAQHKPDLNASK